MILGFIIGGLVGALRGMTDTEFSYSKAGNSMYKTSLNGAIIGGVVLGVIGGIRTVERTVDARSCVVNRGDSFRRRRSRSNSLAPPGLLPQEIPSLPAVPAPPPEVTTYRVALVGAQGVGKTALISQFMTSECINAYDRSHYESNQQVVSIMLNGEESELHFENIRNSKVQVRKTDPQDAFVVLYSVIDKASFQRAEQELNRLVDMDLLRSRPAILVANKIDLARSRAVSAQVETSNRKKDRNEEATAAAAAKYSLDSSTSQNASSSLCDVGKGNFKFSKFNNLKEGPDSRNRKTKIDSVAVATDLINTVARKTFSIREIDGKCLACTFRAKYIEVSVGINHNIDELLVGILNQIRLKLTNAELEDPNSTHPHWYKSRGVVRASLKARQMFTWLFGKEDSKFKNCENLHVL
ncbi:hypothetical protein RUM43_001787 [Polyplax serrata]|uniref:Uncharacterized protein n=1 Tax=Polyplax serrata TaxID=468196 RepID=A0AAN8SEW8_POLSC